MKRLGCLLIVLVSCVAAAASFAAEESSTDAAIAESVTRSLPSLLVNPPENANRVASVVSDVLDTFAELKHAASEVERLRAKHDSLKTELVSINGERNVAIEHGRQLEARVLELEEQEKARIQELRDEFEGRLQTELKTAGEQIKADLADARNRQIQAFEQRQRNAIEQQLQQAIELKERELQQLTEEIELQTDEINDWIGRLDANTDQVGVFERSMAQLLARRQATLQDRRANLERQREAILAERRSAFETTLAQQQQAELQARLRLKEAGLRQAMAQLLETTRRQEETRLVDVRKELKEVKQREAELTSDQGLRSAQLESVGKDIKVWATRVQKLRSAQGSWLGRIEQVLHKTKDSDAPSVLAWFNRLIGQMPAELQPDLNMIHQRVYAAFEQSRQLAERRRVMRERELALQLSREMESRRRKAELARERELASKRAKATELVEKAKLLAERGQYDKALNRIDEAQEISPPDPAFIASVRDEIAVSREKAMRQAQAEAIERLFSEAMKVFESGDYEKAIKLFEQVIAQESQLKSAKNNPSPTLADAK